MPLASIARLQTLERQTLAFVRTRFPGRRATGRQNGRLISTVAAGIRGNAEDEGPKVDAER
jgi:hypothetical protein